MFFKIPKSISFSFVFYQKQATEAPSIAFQSAPTSDDIPLNSVAATLPSSSDFDPLAIDPQPQPQKGKRKRK